MRCLLVVGLVLVGSLAYADKPPLLAQKIIAEVGDYFSGANGAEKTAPRFAFIANDAVIAPESREAATGSLPDNAFPSKKKTTVATSTDGTAAWIASDLEGRAVCGDSPACDTAKPDEYYHLTALYEVKDLAPVAWHFSEPITAKEQKARMTKGTKLDALAKGVGAGAEDVAKMFEASLGDPKVLATSVSDRKDVVLYGSELAERYVGGAAVKKQLEKWSLALRLNGGVQAGVTASKTVAWVAAHVDATPVKNAKAKATPYRLFVIYEKTGAEWKLVSAHFSFI